MATTYGYHDTNFRLESVVTTGGSQDLHYTYDNVGNVQTMDDDVAGLHLTYGYDDLDRLTDVLNYPGGDLSYDYNTIGNLLDKNGLTLYYIVGDHPHAVSHTSDNIVYYYSPTGNMVTKWVGGPEVTFSYDAENRLTQVVSDTTSSAITTTFVYDGDGQRVKKIEGSETTVYIGQHYETSVPSVIYTDTTWISGTYSLNGPLVVTNSATLYLESVVAITACQIIVGPDAAISADGRRYLGCSSPINDCSEQICGPGMGYSVDADDGGGGGHGGYGGCSDLADSGCLDGHSGQIYGDAQTPVTMASGGGMGWDEHDGEGGDDGGSIRLTAETIRIDGRVSADGAWGNCWQWYCGGGGAGGSIWITAQVLTGTGVIETEGGGAPEDVGGYRRSGGGGRIALYYSDGNFDPASGKLSVVGGESVEGYDGEPGTVYTSSAVPTFPPCASSAVKHYRANGQHIATRVDGTLYYVHSDLLGSTVAVSDDQGNSQGHLWYDPHGSVFSSTLPATLTEQLLSSQGLDSQLGLVYHGDGRWYDPALAHTLQPDPLSGVPELPQTLNRYARSGPPLRGAIPSAPYAPTVGFGLGNLLPVLANKTAGIMPVRLACHGTSPFRPHGQSPGRGGGAAYR